MADDFRITGSIADHLSVAFYQNEIPVVKELAFENDSERDLSNVVLRIESGPAFAPPTVIRVDTIGAKSTRHISPIDLKLDPGFLRQLKEGLRGSVHVVASEGETVIAEYRVEIDVCEAASLRDPISPMEFNGLSCLSVSGPRAD